MVRCQHAQSRKGDIGKTHGTRRVSSIPNEDHSALVPRRELRAIVQPILHVLEISMI